MQSEKRIACQIAFALAAIGAVCLAVFVGLLTHPSWGFFAALVECVAGAAACLCFVATESE